MGVESNSYIVIFLSFAGMYFKNYMQTTWRLWPGTAILLCRFHVIKTFRQKITELKVGSVRTELLRELSQKFVYSYTESEYTDTLNDIKRESPQNFHNCRLFRTLPSETENIPETTNELGYSPWKTDQVSAW